MGAAVMIGEDSSVIARGIAVGAVGLGLAALGWGGAVLAGGRVVAARAALAGILSALVAVGALLAASDGRVSVLGAAVAIVMLVAACGLVTVPSRHRSSTEASPRSDAPPRPMRVVPLLIASTLVALVATPALGAVQDAALLRDDGTSVVVPAHDGH